ncbi:LVIVD repeat-containing protein [Jiangella rhizosphaerae]|uniref:LVIVD repeat-containing protein n=1 Tax=Jiangella rhizosphaerae TaxID=2293569 RepID=A0A418KMT6_9ACTN|nr:hypothetical protein [Jiangella rhizosphaerae]RIQ20214.1 hypothetical protein DY240_18850 [Jiangella rhizosphaerae]
MIEQRWRRRATGLAVAALVSGGLAVGSAGISAADDGELLRESTANEECANADAVEGLGDNFEAYCLTEEELAEITEAPDAASILPGGETASSPNLSLVTNLPKEGPFATTSALNSDLAFQGKYVFAGNYNGFTVYNIENPRKPVPVSQVLCPGSQNDISVYGDLLFLSTDSRRTDDSCQSQSLTAQQAADRGSYWEGMKIFDISDVRNPQYIKSVETKCGSHTHTLVPGEDSVYIYVSSYDTSSLLSDCQPPHDLISIIDVPLDEPTAAHVAAEPVLFPDAGNQGGNTRGCHDITAYPHLGLAAGACMGDGVVMDVTDPLNPVILDQVRDPNFAFWHSATFNNEGTSIIFTDELGGGSGPECNPTVGPNRGANAIYTWDGDSLEFASYYKIPREQADTENCVAHNGSLIPVPGKDIFVQAWYQGGISVFDFTDPYNPTEIAWFDRGTFDAEGTIAGAWSTYYYNGYIYSNEIQRGFDVFDLRDPRVAPAKGTRYSEFNVQTQPVY